MLWNVTKRTATQPKIGCFSMHTAWLNWFCLFHLHHWSPAGHWVCCFNLKLWRPDVIYNLWDSGPIHTGRARTNSNANPLMLLACSLDTLIHISTSDLLALRVRVQCGLGLRFRCCRDLFSSDPKCRYQQSRCWLNSPLLFNTNPVVPSQLCSRLYWFDLTNHCTALLPLLLLSMAVRSAR